MEMRADIREYSFSSTDRFFLDANIWVYVYGPVANRENEQAQLYSRALHQMKKREAQLHIDVLVLSEFINSCARIEHRAHCRRKSGIRHRQRKKDLSFKSYRNSRAFQDVALEISINAKKIIRSCSRCPSYFEDAALDRIVESFSEQQEDFNDLMIAEICRRKNLILVTHDADFMNHDIPILSGNYDLLK